MGKDRVYKVVLCMDANVFDVIGAECGFPAGKSLVEAANTLQLFVMPLNNLVVLINHQSLLRTLTDCKCGTNLSRKGANFTSTSVEC